MPRPGLPPVPVFLHGIILPEESGWPVSPNRRGGHLIDSCGGRLGLSRDLPTITHKMLGMGTFVVKPTLQCSTKKKKRPNIHCTDRSCQSADFAQQPKLFVKHIIDQIYSCRVTGLLD